MKIVDTRICGRIVDVSVFILYVIFNGVVGIVFSTFMHLCSVI